ncbi:hypothetical protein A2791_00540 [Candidatus Saccharibacteria bacterium RIFCSPHIGHO2_01_FULL_46_30]|nr:MAG: hypothetical protein A2791_00540 [Candidatus Saccharibacteria bacterium RIFCSPHIGHO2_01_FULL_46_30]
MFQSATLKLTGWYLLILMSISLIFSVTIYNTTTSEVNDRLRQLQMYLERPTVPIDEDGNPINPRYTAFRDDQRDRANKNILLALVYVNLLILVGGGAMSYALARRTLSQIEEVHDRQSRFTSDASHELRTPLAVMKTELEVALRDPKLSKDEMRELLESNLEEVNKLTRLSQMLLQLSKGEHAKLEREPVNITKIVEDVARRYDPSGERIDLKSIHKNLLVHGNLSSIEELVTILIDNALKYSPSDSLVTVRVSKRNNKACVETINTGKGISADDLPKIFDRFYRADSSRTNGEKAGYGLGLSLAKQIVQLHSGELNASSAPGHATTFTVLLPILSNKKA